MVFFCCLFLCFFFFSFFIYKLWSGTCNHHYKTTFLNAFVCCYCLLLLLLLLLLSSQLHGIVYTLGSSKIQFLSLIETIWKVYFYKKKEKACKRKHTLCYLIISNNNNNNINNKYRWLSSSLKRNIINLSIATRLQYFFSFFFFLHFKLSVAVHCVGTYHSMCACLFFFFFFFNSLVMILFALFSGWSFGSVNNTRLTFYMYVPVVHGVLKQMTAYVIEREIVFRVTCSHI